MRREKQKGSGFDTLNTNRFFEKKKNRREKKRRFATRHIYTRVLCSCSFIKRGHKTRERKRKREERVPNDVLLFRVVAYEFYRFPFFVYRILYTHTQTGNHL